MRAVTSLARASEELAPVADAPVPRPQPEVRTVFERFEIKFRVNEEQAREAVGFARAYLKADPNGVDGKQRNTTLYLETSDQEFLQRHLDSEPDRFKLRVRRYGDPPAGPAYFEVKRKVNAVVAKRRAMVPGEAVRSLLEGGPLPVLPRPQDQPHLEAFLYLMTIYRAEPLVFTSCVREAYLSDRVEDTRITVDRELVYQPATEPDFVFDPRGWQSGDRAERQGEGGRAILELKFRGVCPWWMEELVQRLSLCKRGFSKYVNAATHALGESDEDGGRVPIWEV